MDKSWMHEDRRSLIFKLGVGELVRFAIDSGIEKDKICCPCVRCFNNRNWSEDIVKDHCVRFGIDLSYQNWIWHGEPLCSEGTTESVNRESTAEDASQKFPNNIGFGEGDDSDFSEDCGEFLKYVEGGEKPLYPGCTRFTRMSALVKTFNFKARHGLTDACYSDLLIMLGVLLPLDNELPQSMYEVKKTLSVLGIENEKIHACPNDCMIYRDSNADATSCLTCGTSRWKLTKDNVERVGVPAKVFWYFPIIPRFKLWFSLPSTAKSLTWHEDQRIKDGKMRHPADSPTWKIANDIDGFGSEPRNLRLGLSADGFSPHSSLSSKYSCWPVILVTYNLPPELCMKRKFMMLTLLISGPKQPGNDMDVYLQPLIKDFQILSKGVSGVFDAYRNEYFKLRAMLLWTINDFPAYGNLSGSIVRGYNACPICCEQTKPLRLKHGKKMSYMRTRRLLPRHHPYRRNKAAFDNTVELDDAPIRLTGEEVLERVKGMDRPLGKMFPEPPFKGPEADRPCWKKKSIFFDLEYWKFLPVRHNLDVMHIEKNICEALLGTLLNIPGKTKDGEAARLDIKSMGIRPGLETVEGNKKLSLASWNLMLAEKKIVCASFYGMKLCNRFSSNIKSLVSMDDLRLSGLKSHDCHTVLHHLLPISIRSVLEKPVREAIIRFCLFFKAICCKVIDVEKLTQMQHDLVITVCELEMYFPPSFFDIMVHLTVHLVKEVEECGPVFFRWMYPFERYMGTLKGYVHNRSHPEGSIVESYIAEEAVEFLAERMLDEPTVGLPSSGIIDDCKPLSGATIIIPDPRDLHIAVLCVLQNTDEARPYFDEHLASLKCDFPRYAKNEKWLRQEQNRTFAGWLQKKVASELRDSDNDVVDKMRWLAGGPNYEIATFSGYRINGVTFHTKERESALKVQCSGVSLIARTMQVASAKDKKPITSEMLFYGVIQEIWELDYEDCRIPIFKCSWVENDKGIKTDDLGYTSVDLNRIGHLNDPFVLATDVKQVCYIDDPLNIGWSVVLKCPDREWRGVVDDDDDEVEDIVVEQEPFVPIRPEIDPSLEGGEPSQNYMRDGDEEIWVED